MQLLCYIQKKAAMFTSVPPESRSQAAAVIAPTLEEANKHTLPEYKIVKIGPPGPKFDTTSRPAAVFAVVAEGPHSEGFATHVAEKYPEFEGYNNFLLVNPPPIPMFLRFTVLEGGAR